MNAEQKVRQTITGDPFGEPRFETEGEGVIRWITGGNAPDLRVTFHSPQDGGEGILVRCATCGKELGIVPGHDADAAGHAEAIARLRAGGHPPHR